MTKREARKMALREAGGWLVRDADGGDLDPDLSEADEEKVRAQLRLLAAELAERGRP